MVFVIFEIFIRGYYNFSWIYFILKVLFLGEGDGEDRDVVIGLGMGIWFKDS